MIFSIAVWYPFHPQVSAGMQIMLVKEPGKVLSVDKAASILTLVPRVGSKKAAKSIAIPFDGVVEDTKIPVDNTVPWIIVVYK